MPSLLAMASVESSTVDTAVSSSSWPFRGPVAYGRPPAIDAPPVAEESAVKTAAPFELNAAADTLLRGHPASPAAVGAAGH
ncbi:hypothetical protein ACWEV3_43345 [Saccharopolyspora sp. NPDC003752]